MGVERRECAPAAPAASLGLTGRETFSIRGLADGITPKQEVDVEAVGADGTTVRFRATVRIDGAAEVEYFRHGGILQMVLRHMLAG
jgi:aconitate hydratase